MVWSAATLWTRTSDEAGSPPSDRAPPVPKIRLQRAIAELRAEREERLAEDHRRVGPRPTRWSPPRSRTTEPTFIASPRSDGSSPRLSGRPPRGESAATPAQGGGGAAALPLLSEQYLARVAESRAALKHRNAVHWSHVKDVQKTADDRLSRRITAVKSDMSFKAKRFLEPIDRCEDESEAAQLRVETWAIVQTQAAFVAALLRAAARSRALKTLAFLLVPIINGWRLRRRAIAKRYAALWRGRLRRPNIERLLEAVPFISRWPLPSLRRLCRLLRPRTYRAGAFILYEQEPLVTAIIVDGGAVAVVQRVSGSSPAVQALTAPSAAATSSASPSPMGSFVHKGGTVGGGGGGGNFAASLSSVTPLSIAVRSWGGRWRVLGERGAGSTHGEEALEAEAAGARSFASVRCIEAVTAWSLSRSHFQRVAGDIRLDVTMRPSGAGLAMPPLYAIPMMKLKDNPAFHFWDEKRLSDLVVSGRMLALHRGEQLHPRGVMGRSVYFVFKGTLEEVYHACPYPWLLNGRAELRDGVRKKFLNPADSFGEEAVIFNAERDTSVTTVTDVLLFEVPARGFVNGLLHDPANYRRLVAETCTARADRLVKPTGAEIAATGALTVAAAPAFARLASPLVAPAGSSELPLRDCLVLIAAGRVIIDDKAYDAPCALATFDLFDAQPTPLRHRCEGRVDAWIADGAAMRNRMKGVTAVKELLGPRSNVETMHAKKKRGQ
jgi:CRP-like cAMP-binding protein